MTDPLAAVRAELALAEDRLTKARRKSALLERKLLKPTAMRNRVIATVATAALGGTLAYVGARGATDARAARERALRSEASDAIVRVARDSLDACKQRHQKAMNDLVQCTRERDAVHGKFPGPTLGPPCACQVGDPLCSCL